MKKLGGIGLLLLLAAGVWVNSLRPAPNVKAREAVGERVKIDTSVGPFIYHKSGEGPCILFFQVQVVKPAISMNFLKQ